MSFSSFDAILFDKDGTIFDSEQVCCDAWIKAAKLFDVDFTTAMFKKFIGLPTPDCFKMAHQDFGAEFPMDQFIVEVHHFISEQHRIGLPIKKGFDRFFRHLLANNIPCGLVTSAEHDSAIESFRQTDYLEKFKVFVTIKDVHSPKPAPECYLLACEKMGVKPERVLVFEDSNAGIEASIEAGCQTIAIPDMLSIEPRLLNRCYQVLSSFDDAYDVLT
jgi:HAD superfamily hydrolase (TIGR01509 family)